MVGYHPRFVVDENQRRQAVLLPLSEWERIVADLEDLDDIRAYDEAKAGSQEAVPFAEALRKIKRRRCR